MELKVCGMKLNTRDVAKLHPGYLGFIFWKNSPRFFEGEIPSLPPQIQKIGVFVDASVEEIVEKIKKYDLQGVQLHGAEDPDFCKELRIKCTKSHIERSEVREGSGQLGRQAGGDHATGSTPSTLGTGAVENAGPGAVQNVRSSAVENDGTDAVENDGTDAVENVRSSAVGMSGRAQSRMTGRTQSRMTRIGAQFGMSGRAQSRMSGRAQSRMSGRAQSRPRTPPLQPRKLPSKLSRYSQLKTVSISASWKPTKMFAITICSIPKANSLAVTAMPLIGKFWKTIPRTSLTF